MLSKEEKQGLKLLAAGVVLFLGMTISLILSSFGWFLMLQHTHAEPLQWFLFWAGIPISVVLSSLSQWGINFSREITK